MTAATDLFDSVWSQVMVLTKRDDLEEETSLAVRTATFNAHMAAFFPKDMVTQAVALPTPAYVASLDVTDLFPLFRAVSGIRLLDASGEIVENPKIEVKEIEDIYDPVYGFALRDIAYQAGTAVNVRCSVQMSGLLVTWFKAPSTARDTYNSWVAQFAPDVLIYSAAAIVLGTTGNEAKAKMYQTMYEKQLLPDLIRNFLLGQAR